MTEYKAFFIKDNYYKIVFKYQIYEQICIGCLLVTCVCFVDPIYKKSLDILEICIFVYKLKAQIKIATIQYILIFILHITLNSRGI